MEIFCMAPPAMTRSNVSHLWVTERTESSNPEGDRYNGFWCFIPVAYGLFLGRSESFKPKFDGSLGYHSFLPKVGWFAAGQDLKAMTPTGTVMITSSAELRAVCFPHS
jgi:hypothetical protein